MILLDEQFLKQYNDLFSSRVAKLGYDDSYEANQQWHQEFGPTFGIFLGKQLQIVVSEEEMLKEIFIKNFNNFSDRCVPGLFKYNQLNFSLLQATKANGWKESRSTISPTFSTGKMKAMHETIQDKNRGFLEYFWTNMPRTATRSISMTISKP
ncbi:unnamed protein product [Caenorhabditis auriculariae]|uniref:Uncharacterized protein n=1 Tax=Caenorhabditis auriculariae TaxID=2777116 RepID=A0A8S1HJ73_9PELO|nr:unnamed protein product [Caenorhabditis auriculariae]